jgi:diaminopimelate epimerase
MEYHFNKYQGTGNDFIIIDNRNGSFDPGNIALINKMCDRRFGVGADGLILISENKPYDFEMKYFNSDGKAGTMCGNGGRCISHFAVSIGLAGKETRFIAADGIHEARINDNIVELKMNDVVDIRLIDDNYFINTGSPHYMVFVKNAAETDVFEEGKKLRWSGDFAPGGTNVNFVEVTGKGIFVRTFERGVENETLSCGTGSTAAAIASVLAGHLDTNRIDVKTLGGDLSVSFEIVNNKEIRNIWLRGPAEFVFSGMISL